MFHSPEKPPSAEKMRGQPLATQPLANQALANQALAAGPSERGLQLPARVSAPSWEVAIAAVILDFTPGEVILLMDDPIAAGTRVTVQLNSASFTGDILFCEPRGHRYEAHVTFDDVDEMGLRRTPRFPVSLPARLFSSAISGPGEGQIVDVSDDGLGIELAEPVPPESNIAIQTETNVVLGEVRHCRPLSSGLFRAGVRLHHVIQKDPDLVQTPAESGWINRLGARFLRKKADGPR
jgi:hypothetical protein